MGFEINNKQCSSCIFGANSPIPKDRLNFYKQEWAKKDTHQICHHSTFKGSDVACRGYYDAAIVGAVHMGQLLRIADRLHAIIFVDVPENHDKENED